MGQRWRRGSGVVDACDLHCTMYHLLQLSGWPVWVGALGPRVDDDEEVAGDVVGVPVGKLSST